MHGCPAAGTLRIVRNCLFKLILNGVAHTFSNGFESISFISVAVKVIYYVRGMRTFQVTVLISLEEIGISDTERFLLGVFLHLSLRSASLDTHSRPIQYRFVRLTTLLFRDDSFDKQRSL